MLKRVLSGFMILGVLGVIVVLTIFWSYGMNIAIGLITAVMVHELSGVFGLKKNPLFLIPSMAFGCGVPLIPSVIPSVSVLGNLYLMPSLFWSGAACAAYLFIMVAFMLFTHEKNVLKDWLCAIGLTCFITIAMTTLVGVRDISNGHGGFYVFIVFMAPWVADCGAYFAGSFFGRHKLCPKLSPKKTIEGVFGGFFLNVLAMLVYGTFYNLIFFGGTLHMSYLSLVLIGLTTTVVSIVGDLAFSMIKRSCNIKDYGNIIPGHGGFIDRFDSVIFVSPYLFFFLQLLPMVKF